MDGYSCDGTQVSHSLLPKISMGASMKEILKLYLDKIGLDGSQSIQMTTLLCCALSFSRSVAQQMLLLLMGVHFLVLGNLLWRKM